MHAQPKGPFALYVFCDDALGSNVAVVLKKLHNPLSGKYSREKRFWQGEQWAKDVTSYAWLEDGKHLLLATSYIYGTGSVYLLNLETQQFQVKNPIKYGACLASLRQVDDKKLDVAITDCEDEVEYKFEFAM
jgi:hypothetical protein